MDSTPNSIHTNFKKFLEKQPPELFSLIKEVFRDPRNLQIINKHSDSDVRQNASDSQIQLLEDLYLIKCYLEMLEGPFLLNIPAFYDKLIKFTQYQQRTIRRRLKQIAIEYSQENVGKMVQSILSSGIYERYATEVQSEEEGSEIDLMEAQEENQDVISQDDCKMLLRVIVKPSNEDLSRLEELTDRVNYQSVRDKICDLCEQNFLDLSGSLMALIRKCYQQETGVNYD